jgi:hypothetical protein
MVTTTKLEQVEPDSPNPADDPLVRKLEKLPGWDSERRAWVHGDPGQEALALVNAAAAAKNAKPKRP